MFLALEEEEWKEVKAYPVKGKQGLLLKEKLSFGDYKTLEADRSRTKGSEVTIGLTVVFRQMIFIRRLSQPKKSTKSKHSSLP
jgi:hypothetical protein